MLTLLRVLAEDPLDRLRLGLVAQRRAGAVGVDVVDRRPADQLRVAQARRSSRGRRRCLARRAA